MSSTTIPNSNQHEVAEDFDVSSDLPLRLTSSSRQSTVNSITSSVFTSASSVHESAYISLTPFEQGDFDASAGDNTNFGISFGPAPPNTPAENNDAISLSDKPQSKSGWTGEYSQSDPGTSATSVSKSGWTGEYSQPYPGSPVAGVSKSGWTGEYSDPGTSAAIMSKLGWTGEYSTSGVEPEHLMARLSTVANKSEDESDKIEYAEEGRSSGESSWTQGDDSESTVGDVFSEDDDVTRLAPQAVRRFTPGSIMESLDVKHVKSSVVTITASEVQPQSAVLCNIEDESIPESEEAEVFSPTEANSTKDAKFIKKEKTSIMGRISSCMRALKMCSRPKPQIPVNQPKHTSLSPEKPCLKPVTSLAGTALDRTEEDSPLQPVPVPKPSKGTRVTFDLDETAKREKSKSKSKGKFNPKIDLSFNISPYLFSEMNNLEAEETSDEDDEDLDDPNSPFAEQDVEVERCLVKAEVFRNANERTAIVRGALDFLLVVSDRVDTVAADRIGYLLHKTGDRGLGSYTGEEKDHRERRGEEFVNGVWTLQHKSRNKERYNASKGVEETKVASKKRKISFKIDQLRKKLARIRSGEQNNEQNEDEEMDLGSDINEWGSKDE
ncbi:hypothetical protein FGADI_9224 [Fusarium gaditjirri]|uniref:Uncharacterized protein n=1 Tax=Fusarium gaditjirri TaxID=282569 RepID=A0A8H4T078_9HYPO|nr:hypothetical protein FGADI_9224 [Fusarium gaditjirri]